MAEGTKAALNCVLLISALAFVVVLVNGGHWNEWNDLTLCDAEPCDCPSTEICGINPPKGKKMQIRTCDMSDSHACQGAFLREADCRGNNEFCPEWSAWSIKKCECNNGENIRARKCIQRSTNSLKCETETGEMALEEEQFIFEEHAKGEFDCRKSPEVDCTIEVMSTLAPPITAPPEVLPCCNVSDIPITTTEDYPFDLSSAQELIRRRRSDDIDYDAYDNNDIPCRNCTSEEFDEELG